MTELMPCPFCGDEMQTKCEGEPGHENWWTECRNCICCGPHARTEAEAIRLSNTRPAPSPSDAACPQSNDVAETIQDCPHSWAAWKREAERLGAELADHKAKSLLNALEPTIADLACDELQASLAAAEKRIKELEAALSAAHKVFGCESDQLRAMMAQLKSPSPSREGWLTRAEVDDLVPAAFARDETTEPITAGHLRGLCRMALSALRPTETEEEQ